MKNILIYRKKYRMRTTGAGNATYEVSIPKDLVEQEAKKAKLLVKEFFKLHRAEWFFGDELGMAFVRFVKK